MPTQSGASRPNIIVILADDMGYSDIGCFGAEIRTPNLDRLARSGTRFSQMYNCARCCPTRASLLTGLYPHQAGVGLMVGNMGVPAYQGYLNDNCVTIAEALRPAGYRTLISGKWHVGGFYPQKKPQTWNPGAPGFPTPYTRGFDQTFAMLAGGSSYFDPLTLSRNDVFLPPPTGPFYMTDAFSDNAIPLIEGAVADAKPFFLYLSYTAPHWPLHALPEDIAKYEGTYRRGWDTLRKERHEQLKGMGILSKHWPISPRDEKSRPWDETSHQDWEDLRMAVYAAQIDRMDQGIGRVLACLERLGIADNTLVMFLSDNGGCAEFLGEDTGKPQPFAYNIPTRDGRPIYVGNVPNRRPGADDTFMSYDLPWANASNSPFRLYKHWVHEGGISTPLVASWPAGIKASGIVHDPCHVVDIMATCLDAAGASYPREHKGHAIHPMEGQSMLPLMQGRPYGRQRPIFWEHEGNCAVRDGIWKLVRRYPDDWELYNMLADRTELHNLADSEPDRVKRMVAEHEAWAARCGVQPWPLKRPAR